MLTLMLLRHAKSVWPKGQDDHERCLAERGRLAAPLIGSFMKRENLNPDLVLVSSARRTQETWDLVAPFLSPVVVQDEPRLYEAHAVQIVDVIRDVPAGITTLLLVGHNPGMEDLARLLNRSGSAPALERMRYKYPTAGLAISQFEVDDWSELDWNMGHLTNFVTPKSLGAEQDD